MTAQTESTKISDRVKILAKQVFTHPCFWLLIVVLVAFWPLTLQLKTVPYDMINCWMPWRFFISDTIQNGEFPWWNPYQQLGYPIHSDIQGPSWHLESLLASMAGRQGAYYINYILLFYMYLAGIGFYKLTSLFTTRKLLLFIGATAYVCSGFFSNHSMHFFAIISGAFVPFIVYYFIRLYQTKKWHYALLTAVFGFFNLTGGNQTFTVILIYLLGILFIYFLMQVLRQDKAAITRFFKHTGLLIGSLLLMGTVVLFSFIQMKPYLSRLDGLTYRDASTYGFVPEAMLSFLNPMATVNEKVWLETDGTMANAYFGIILLIFLLIYCAAVKKRALERVFLGFAIFALFASFGSHSFIHKLTYDYLPLLNRFRFPSYYTYFFIFCAIPLAVKAIDLYFFKPITDFRPQLKWTQIRPGLLVFLMITGLTVGMGWANLSDQPFFETDGSIFQQLRKTDLYQNWFYFGLIQLFFLGICVLLIWKRRLKAFVITMAIHAVVSVQPNFLYVGVGDVAPAQIQHSLATLNSSRLPPLNPVIQNDFRSNSVPGLWQNLNHITKKVGVDGFNSNYFSRLSALNVRHSHLFNKILANPYVYLSDEVVHQNVFLSDTSKGITQRTILLNTTDYQSISAKSYQKHPEDTVITKAFTTNKFTFETTTKTPLLLNLLQTHYVGWKVYVDGEEKKIVKANTCCMSVEVPAGTHQVEFRYENTAMKGAAVISYLTFTIVTLLLAAYYIRQRRQNWMYISLLYAIPLVIVVRYILLVL